MDRQVTIEVRRDGSVIRTELIPFFGALMRVERTILAGPTDGPPPIPDNDRRPLGPAPEG